MHGGRAMTLTQLVVVTFAVVATLAAPTLYSIRRAEIALASVLSTSSLRTSFVFVKVLVV
jgi:hypothetical protein